MKYLALNLVAAAIALAGLSAPALAEPMSFFEVEGVSYDDSVPGFEDAMGYEIGERPVRYADLVSYLTLLAERSPNIEVETIGYSHELRPILTFIVTSPDNHDRLDEIRENHLARARGEDAPDDTPMVLWINFGVHGAESSGMDSAIPLLHHFAAAQGDAVEAKLDNAVMLFTVAFNPDGHSRRVDHTETYWSYADNTDINDAAHDLWTEARTNHYWFDLNRQWLLLTQPESQAWVRKWHEWKPMVSADYHEMGSDSPFYFHPGEALRRNPLIPERARDLTFEIARRHAAFLDTEARLYTTQENFDNFYIGKGSTYPQINGSLGILFEIGAARGGAVETERGLVEHADNVRTQFRTALTTLEGSLDLREEITAYQRDFFARARSAAQRGDQQAWVFGAEGDPERARRFVRLLRQHDIEVLALTRDLQAGGRRWEAGESYLVPLAQQQYAMIRGIFDQTTEFAENIFYDVSGWTLPLAYDLEFAPVSGGLFQTAPAGDPATGEFTPAAAPDRAPYAYIFDWGHTYAPRALNRVLSEGLFARAAREPFTVETTQGEADLDRGAIVVPLARQEMTPADIHALMETIAAEDGVEVHAARSGLTPTEGRDLGAWNVFATVTEPKVLLAIGGGVSWYDAGEVWWTLDYRHRMPVTLVDTRRLGSLDWDEYTHLVIAGGDANFDEDLTEAVTGWVRGGGTVIATRGGAQWAQGAFFDDEANDGASDEGAGVQRYDASEMRLRDAEHVIGGAIFEGDLDPSHPLGFGYRDRVLPLHRNQTFTLTRPEDPFAVPVQYVEEPLLSGYASERRIGEIAGTPAVVARRLGSGSVILMADNPVFRGTFAGTEKLLMNAIFFSSLIDRARGDYEE